MENTFRCGRCENVIRAGCPRLRASAGGPEGSGRSANPLLVTFYVLPRIMRRVLISVTAVLALAVPASAQTNCKKGIPCGNTCIAANKTCRVGTGSATAPRAEPRAPAPAQTPAETASAATCRVARISDGDTLTCEGGEKVRLLLIDTPELSQAPDGGRARDELRRLAPAGTLLRMESDVEKQDRYGRTLAYLWLPDGRMVNEEVARSGYALVLSYPPNVRHIDRMRAAVEEAKRERRGLWATSAFECSPRDFRAKRCG